MTGHELRRRGHVISYIVPKYSKKDYRLIDSPLTEKSVVSDVRRKLPVHRLPAGSFPGSPTGQWRLVIPFGASLPYLRKFNPDIIHTQTPFGTGFEALLASKVFRVPLVGTNHTPIEEFVRYIPPLEDKLLKFARLFNAWYYNHCVFLTAPNDGLLDDMRRAHLFRPARSLPNPVLIDTFRVPTAEQKAALKKRHGLQGSIVMYAGRLATEKHVDIVIRAIARLKPHPPVTLMITGHGMAESELRSLARELNVSERVQFTGFVSAERLVELYQAADVFVIMSTAELQSLALMQAFASGLPAVAARARGLPEYASAECSFLVEPGDERALAERLEKLMTDETLRARMGEAGAKFVKQYAPNIIADEWEEIYFCHMKRRK